MLPGGQPQSGVRKGPDLALRFGSRKVGAALGSLDNRPQALVEGLRRSALAYAGGLRDDLQVWSIVRQR